MNEIHEQAHAFAVGALSPAEASEFQAHLDGCRPCRREVASMLDVTSSLSDSVAVEPPPGLRASVLAEIARTPQARPDHQAAPVAAQASNVVPIRRSRTTVASSLLAAAAVVTAVAFGGLAWQSREDARDATAQSTRLTQLLSADDVQTVHGVSQKADHTGAIVMSRSEGRAMFVASELPDLPQDEVYEAWTIDGNGRAVAAGTFSPVGSQSTLPLPKASFAADTMAITVEPDGGSDRPTSDAVVTFAMPQA